MLTFKYNFQSDPIVKQNLHKSFSVLNQTLNTFRHFTRNLFAWVIIFQKYTVLVKNYLPVRN